MEFYSDNGQCVGEMDNSILNKKYDNLKIVQCYYSLFETKFLVIQSCGKNRHLHFVFHSVKIVLQKF